MEITGLEMLTLGIFQTFPPCPIERFHSVLWKFYDKGQAMLVTLTKEVNTNSQLYGDTYNIINSLNIVIIRIFNTGAVTLSNFSWNLIPRNFVATKSYCTIKRNERVLQRLTHCME